MAALSIIINVVLILISIVLIVAVLMQEGQRQGLGAIGGGAETFLGKNKANTLEGKLKLITKVAAVVFIVLAIVATMVTAHINNMDEATETVIEETETVEGEEAVEGETAEEEAAETEAETETEAAETEAEATAEPTEEPAAEATEAPAEEEAAE